MWDKIIARLREPSTAAGLAAVTYGVGQIAKIDEAPAVAEAISTVAPLLAGGDWLNALLVGFGTMAVVLREKGGK